MITAIGSDEHRPQKYQILSQLWHKFGDKFIEIEKETQAVLEKTIRSSSIVENVNSVLRGYFFLRKSAGTEFLKLLQFFLNHRVIKNSPNEIRNNKTPREALTGVSHPHWLELLGYQRQELCA